MISDEQLLAMQNAWQFRGGQRPSFAQEPGPGQESVWDYPRPPALALSSRHVQVWLDVII